MPDLRPHERWIWTELIGFDATADDCGVAEYLADCGFTPTVISLLVTSPDFVLSHVDQADEVELPPDFCARDGHELGRNRQRQVWTNLKLKRLIDELHQRRVQVYLSVFTRWYGDRWHPEWLGQHQEVFQVFRTRGRAHSLNVLARLTDGTLFEDIFVPKLVQTLQDYGFDGWHGCDGWGPLSGPLYETSVSDDMIEQFREHTGLGMPEVVTQPSSDEIEKLEARGRWLWHHQRQAWIGFWADRWTSFWSKALDALHAAGKTAIINNAWARAPFESLYRYGIDYQRIVAAGVDGIMVETAHAGLHLHPGFAGPTRHDEFVSMLLLVRAYVPEAKLIFLHNVHDIVEQWNAVHHVPTLLEKDILSLTDLWLQRPEGYQPAADGLFACLGDGLEPRDWQWLERRWKLAFGPPPAEVLGATILWSDAVMQAELPDFEQHRTWFAHRLIFHLMAHGAPVAAAARVTELGASHPQPLSHAGVRGVGVPTPTPSDPPFSPTWEKGPGDEGRNPAGDCLLIPRADLLPADERELALARGPLVAFGHTFADWPEPDWCLRDVHEPRALECRIYGATPARPEPLPAAEPEELPSDLSAIVDDSYYWTHPYTRAVSDAFLEACASAIQQVTGAPYAVSEREWATVTATRGTNGTLRCVVKSRHTQYLAPEIEAGREIVSARVVSDFPLLQVRVSGSKFSIRVPPQGATVVEVEVR